MKRMVIGALCVVLGCAAASVSAAQSVTVAAEASALNMGSVIVFPVRLDQGRRFGYLAYVAWFDSYAVVVSHPSRSGPAGAIPVAGLCIEPMFQLPPGDWWMFGGNAPLDGDGDGDDDLVVQEMAPPQRFRVINLDVVACR